MTLLGVLSPAPAASGNDLNLARDYFLIADYRSCLDKLEHMLAGPLLPEERVDSLVLRGRCRVALGARSGGVDSFCSVLALDPTWRPGLGDFTPTEMRAFDVAVELCGPPIPEKPRTTPPTGMKPLHSPAAPPDAPSPLPPAISQAASGSSWYRYPLLVAGAGGLLAGVLLLGGSTEEPPAAAPRTLPGFPPPPE